MPDDTLIDQRAIIEFDSPVDLDDVAHPYDAAERVLDARD